MFSTLNLTAPFFWESSQTDGHKTDRQNKRDRQADRQADGSRTQSSQRCSVLTFTAWIHIYQNLWGELREAVESTASTADAAPVTPMALAAFADLELAMLKNPARKP